MERRDGERGGEREREGKERERGMEGVMEGDMLYFQFRITQEEGTPPPTPIPLFVGPIVLIHFQAFELILESGMGFEQY